MSGEIPPALVPGINVPWPIPNRLYTPLINPRAAQAMAPAGPASSGRGRKPAGRKPASNNDVTLLPEIPPLPIPEILIAPDPTAPAPMLPTPSVPVLPPVAPAVPQRLVPCEFGWCAENSATTTTAGMPTMLSSPRGMAIRPGMPTDSVGARMSMEAAYQTLGQTPPQWDTQAIGGMQRTPQFQQYVNSLTPLFGDGAWAVATEQMARNNGLGGALLASTQGPGVFTARQQAASQLQALGLAGGDTSAMERAAQIDPGLFAGGMLTTLPGGGVAAHLGGVPLQPPAAPTSTLDYELGLTSGMPGLVQARLNAQMSGQRAMTAAQAAEAQQNARLAERILQIEGQLTGRQITTTGAGQRAAVRAATTNRSTDSRAATAAAALAHKRARDAATGAPGAPAKPTSRPL